MPAFEFFNERRSDQESGEHNEKLHSGEATESESSHYLLSRPSPMRSVLHSVSHECLLQKQVAQPQLQEHLDRSSGITKTLPAPAHPSVPTLLRRLPIDSIPSPRPDTSRRP